jgi:hypothetical protein
MNLQKLKEWIKRWIKQVGRGVKLNKWNIDDLNYKKRSGGGKKKTFKDFGGALVQ